MSRLLDGKVALVSGAARGQGRADVVRLAAEGAAVIAFDHCGPIDVVPYPLPTPQDLEETANIVERSGGDILVGLADVRDQASIDAIVEAGVERFGTIDVVVANAGVNASPAPAYETDERTWQTIVDINLSGVWRTVKAAVPTMINARRGGSIVIISSVGGAKGYEHVAPYISAKHGLIGLMKSLARELAGHRIRVNAVLPTNVDTPMIRNDEMYRLMRPDLDRPTLEDALPSLKSLNAMDVAWVEPEDVANAVVWLASDQARYITGAQLPVDAGALLT